MCGVASILQEFLSDKYVSGIYEEMVMLKKVCEVMGMCQEYMGPVRGVQLSCYLVLLSTDSKTR